MDPLLINDHGDRKRRLADFVFLVAGIDEHGQAAFLSNRPQANTSTTAVTPTQSSKTVAAAGTAERLAAVSTLVESVELFARKNRTTANVGDVYIGFAAGAGLQKRTLAPGDSFPMSAPAGKKIDLHDVWLDAATNGDGVIISTFN